MTWPLRRLLGLSLVVVFAVLAATTTRPAAVLAAGIEPSCGDGNLDEVEECDDGNTADGDGCNATCQNECGGDVREWNHIVKLEFPVWDDFNEDGKATAVDGDTVVVGAIDDGSAYVFERDADGIDAWGQVARLPPFEGGVIDYGWSVTVSGDTLVVGSRGGAAYVFERNVGGADAWGPVAKLIPSDAAPAFGVSVSIDGDTVVVGATYESHRPGSAFVFERNEGGADAWGQVAKLTASDAWGEDHFGWSTSVSDDTVVVGAYSDDVAGSGSGSAYVFERNAGGADAWGQVAKLTASDAAADDYFGWSVAVSGGTVVVGAHRRWALAARSGSAYVFERDAGGADAWGQVARLTASNATPRDVFGWSVSVSGHRIVVGATHDDYDALQDAGSVHVFERNAGGADAWSQVAELRATDPWWRSGFGNSVSLSGDTVVVGNDNLANDNQSAYILTSGCVTCGDEIRHAPEECDDGAANSDALPDACRTDCTLPSCGDAVADGGEACDDGAGNSDTAPDACRTDCTLPACGDGVTDTGEECDDGKTIDGDGCNALCRNEFCGDGIVNNGWASIPTAELTTSDGTVDGEFGSSVSVDGDTVVVGASSEDEKGAAYVFERNMGGADAWGPVTRLTASDAGPWEGFGASVAVSADIIVVGSSGDAHRFGAAYVFERNVGGANAWGQVARLTASDGAYEDWFGSSVSVWGDTVVVGAIGNDDAGSHSGSAYVFGRNVGGVGAWRQAAKLTASDAAAGDWFGRNVSVSGDTVVVAAEFDDDARGSVYVFERNVGGADAWGQVAKLTASDAAPYDLFGGSVSVSGDTVVVGAHGDDDAGSHSGSAYVFERDAGGADAWGQAAKLAIPDAAQDDEFGGAVSVSGDTIVVGAAGDDTWAGSAYAFERDVGGADAWGQVAKLTASDGDAYDDSFGGSVSVSGNTIVVGKTDYDGSGAPAYILTHGREECDDGNSDDDDGCNAACRNECGDESGTNTWQPEDCDNGIDDDCDGLIDAGDQDDCIPLVLDAIRATLNADRTVTIGWRTVLEVDLVGFRVLRTGDSRRVGEAEELTLQPILPRGDAAAGAEYTYVDTHPIIGRSHYYVVGIDQQGWVQRFGPVPVDVPSTRTAPETRINSTGRR